MRFQIRHLFSEFDGLYFCFVHGSAYTFIYFLVGDEFFSLFVHLDRFEMKVCSRRFGQRKMSLKHTHKAEHPSKSTPNSVQMIESTMEQTVRTHKNTVGIDFF